MADPLSSAPSQAEIEKMVREASMAMQRGDYRGAEAIAARGIDAGAENPFLLKMKAFALHQRGEYRDALRTFHHARTLDPNDPATLNGIAGCLTAIGEYRAAIEIVEASLALSPDAQPTHYLRGWVLERAGEFEAARSAYAGALALAPNDATVLAALAATSAALEDFDAARARAHQALAADQRQITALSALATADIAQGKARDVEPKLRGILQGALPPQMRTQIQSLLGDALDALNRPADAFAVWTQKVEESRRGAAPPSDPIAAFAEALAGTSRDDWSGEPVADGHTAPVFVTGTGTEVMARVFGAMANVLRSHGSLNNLAHEHLRTPEGLAALAAIKGSELLDMRDTYWTELNAGENPPLILEQGVRYPVDLPLIAKLFPQAHVLVHTRDPRDAVLDAFRHQSGNGPGFTLAECAQAYIALLSFAAACREKLPLVFHDVRQEDLVADFEGGVKQALDGLGLEMPSEMPKLLRRVQQSTGIWRRYREPMAAVLPLLTPWAEKLGYPAE